MTVISSGSFEAVGKERSERTHSECDANLLVVAARNTVGEDVDRVVALKQIESSLEDADVALQVGLASLLASKRRPAPPTSIPKSTTDSVPHSLRLFSTSGRTCILSNISVLPQNHHPSERTIENLVLASGEYAG